MKSEMFFVFYVLSAKSTSEQKANVMLLIRENGTIKLPIV